MNDDTEATKTSVGLSKSQQFNETQKHKEDEDLLPDQVPKPRVEIQSTNNPKRNDSAQATNNVFDRGWSWAVLIGVIYIMIVNQILAPSFGVMFKDFIIKHQMEASLVVWIFNIQIFTWNITGLFAGPLCSVFGWRKITIIGSVIGGISLLVTAFTFNKYQLFFSYSLLSGIGSSLTTTVCFFIIPHYWRKRKGFATGIMMISGSLGLFIGPQIISILQDKLDFKISTIILGCAFFFCCVSGLLFKERGKPASAAAQPSFTTIGLLGCSTTATSGVVAGLDESSIQSLNKTKLGRFMNSFTLTREFMISITKSFLLLRYKRAIIIALSASLISNCYYNALALCPIIIKGHSAWVISVNAASGFVGKFVISTISDLDFMKNRRGSLGLFGVALLIAGILGFSLTTDITYQLIMMGFQGLGGGIALTLYPLIIIDLMELKDYPHTFGIASLFTAFSSIIIGPLIGYTKDNYGDFDLTLQILAGIASIGFCLSLLMPLAVKHDLKMRTCSEIENPPETYRKSILDP